MTEPVTTLSALTLAQPMSSAERQQFVIFSLDRQQYGIDIMSVREIRMMQPITYLPGAPDYICGVINLRGSIVPVCDLRTRFWQGRSDPGPSHGIVIVAIDGRLNGLLVDEVLDIVTYGAADIAPVPQVQARAASPMFKGLVTSASGMMIVLDIEQLLAAGREAQPASDRGH